MKWDVPKQLGPEEKRLVDRMRRKSKFYVFLREIRSQLFDDAFQDELASAYQPRGQQPVPPSLLAMVVLLQAYTQLSDADAVDAAEMDLRWQLVLGTLGEAKAPFGQGSLSRFRTRLVEHGLDRRLVERTVELAKETKAFGWQKLKAALDSSPLVGCGRVEDSWNLIGRAMSQLVDILSESCDVPRVVIVHDAQLTLLEGPSFKASLDIDWTKEEEKSAALQLVVEQAQSLLSWGKQHASDVLGIPKVQHALEALERVLGQDTEPDPDRPGAVRIKRGVPGDRVCSVGDPDMRHGRKSRTKAFNGYKRYIAASVDVPLVFAAEVRPANEPEREAVPALLSSLRSFGELESLHIDRGFLAHSDVAKLDRQGVKIRCRPWRGQNRTGLFTKDDFRINLRRRVVTCPAGNQAQYTTRSMRANFGESCSACELKSRCTESDAGRTLVIHEHESLHRRLAHASSTRAGRRELRARVSVEHRLARIGSLQTARARYKGTAKNNFDLRRYAALANLIEIQSALATAFPSAPLAA